MRPLWSIVAVSGIAFATAADAFVLDRRIGTFANGAPPVSPLSVYAGCTAPPSAPDSYSSSKDWYFSVDPAVGHPPSYYDNLGVPQSQWGDVAHPFDNPNAIWGQDLPGWGNNTYPVANNNLNVLALYGFYRTTTNFVIRDATDYGNPQAADPNHYRLWPGDTVWLAGDAAGDKFQSFNTNPGGSSALQSNLNVDGSGATKWTWIKANPAFPTPTFYSPTNSTVVLVPDTQGVIIDGLNVQASFDYTQLTTAGLTGLPSTGSPQGSGGPTGFANNSVSQVPLTGGHGSGATGTLTFNTSGQVQGFALTRGGTGYKAGDVLGVATNSGWPTTNAHNGVGSLTGFSVNVQYPNTQTAANLIGINGGEVPNSSLVATTPFTGTTITVNTDLAGTIKTFTYGGGTNPIPYPGTQSYMIDALLNAEYTLSHDSAVNALYNITEFASSYNTTWKTLTSITAPPSNGNTFTFGWDGSTWTWVTSGATGNQINIPATNTLTNAINAAQVALAAAYTSSLTVTSVTSGSTGVSWTAKTTTNQIVWGPAVPATASPDLPAANSTFTYQGVSTADTWTFKASGATGHQVNIGASVGDTIINIQTALAAAYPGTTIANVPMPNGGLSFRAVNPGVDGVIMMTSNYPYQNANVDGTSPAPFLYLGNTSVGVNVSGGSKGIVAIDASSHYISASLNATPPINNAGSADFTSGNTFTFDAITYTWGATGTHPIALGGNVDASLANAVTVVNATDGTLTVPATGGQIANTKDVIINGLNIGAWGVGHAFSPYGTDYPDTGSLKIDTVTGSHGGWAHNDWNINDWLTTPYFVSIQINGIRDSADAGPQPVTGTSCVALNNTYSHHIPTIAMTQAQKVLLKNVYVNYNSDGDSFDNFTSHDIEYNNVWAVNPLNPLHGIHPDGIQFGAGGTFTLSQGTFLWENMSILNSHFIGGTDPMLNDPINHPELFTTGWDGVVYPIIDQQTGLNDTAVRLHNIRVANSVFATDNIDFYLPWAQGSVFVNNSVFNHGSFPAGGNGAMTIGNFLSQVGVTSGNNVIQNNLSVGIGYGSSGSNACADTSNTINNNITIPTYQSGVLVGPTGGGFLCNRAVPPDRGTLGASPPSSLFGTGTNVVGIATLPTDGQSMNNINSINYTWKNSPAGPTQVQIGVDIPTSLANAVTTITAHDSTVYVRHNASQTGLNWGYKTTSEENGGVLYRGTDPVVDGLLQAWSPPANDIADTTQINPAPPGYPSAPTGGLVCMGTNAGGYAPTTNIDGLAWGGGTGCIGIGAY